MNNQKGFGLIEMMISCGILAVVLLASGTMTLTQLKSNNTTTMNSNVNALVNQIQSALIYNPNLIAGQSVNDDVTIYNPLNNSDIIVKAGQTFNNDTWGVTNISLTNKTISGNNFKGTIVLTISKNTTRVFGSPVVTRLIGDVYCTLDASLNTCLVPESLPPPVSEDDKDVDDHEENNNDDHHTPCEGESK